MSGAVQVGYIDNEVVINPSRKDLQHSQLNLIVSAAERKKVGEFASSAVAEKVENTRRLCFVCLFQSINQSVFFTVRRYALHGLSYRNSVCPSVRLSHSWTVFTWFDLRS